METIYYLLIGLMLSIPFGLAWYSLFRLIKKNLRTTLSFNFLSLCTIVAIMAYCGLCVALFSKIRGQLGDLLMGVAYAIGMTVSFLLFPSLVITTIFFILHWLKRRKRTDTQK